MSVIITSQKNVDLSQGFYVNTNFVDGVLKIGVKKTAPGGLVLYSPSGIYESPVLDLGERYREILKVAFTANIPATAGVEVYTTTSSDGYNFSEYALVNSNGTINSPQGRYIKIKLVLKAGHEERTTTVQDFTEAEAGQFEENPYVLFDGSLQLKTFYEETLSPDPSWTEAGALFKKQIDRQEFKAIEQIFI